METDLQHVHAERSRLNIANWANFTAAKSRVFSGRGPVFFLINSITQQDESGRTTTSTYRKYGCFLHQCDGSVQKKSDFLTLYTTFTVKKITKSFSACSE